MTQQHHNVLVFVPTYNEKENINRLYAAIRKETDAHILFCDENSPDGTGILADQLAQQDARVNVVHREKKLGLGTAHLMAFEYAMHHNYDYLITMDADFTHDPVYIPALLASKETGDLVIGSRYVQGAGMKNWGAMRLRFTYLWRNLIKYGLKLPYDATGAFRLYNMNRIDKHTYCKTKARGFAFFIESLFYLHHNGAKIVEVPIYAHNRTDGKSKLSRSIMYEGAKIFLKLLFKKKYKSN